MKRLLAGIIGLMVVCSFAGCAAIDQPKLYSQKGIEKKVGDLVSEVYTIKSSEDKAGVQRVWTCVLPNRANLEFTITDTVSNEEVCLPASLGSYEIEGSWSNDLTTNYCSAIKKSFNSEIKAHADKYGIKFEKDKSKKCNKLTIPDKSKLDDLVTFICELDQLYSFETSDAKAAGIGNPDWIVFEKENVAIESVEFSTSNKSRLSPKDVKEALVRKFNSQAAVDDIIISDNSGSSSDSGNFLDDLKKDAEQKVSEKIDEKINETIDNLPSLDELLPGSDDETTSISPDENLPETKIPEREPENTDDGDTEALIPPNNDFGENEGNEEEDGGFGGFLGF